jgi:hypothetical protein
MGENLGELLTEIRKASENLDLADNKYTKRFEALEGSVNECYLKLNRPGAAGFSENVDERKDAAALCCIKHELNVPKNDGVSPVYTPSSSEIDDAMLAKKALHSLFRHGNIDRLDPHCVEESEARGRATWTGEEEVPHE